MMADEKPRRCFVVQGFGEKTDFRTGRVLNLDDSYEIIKEAVETAGLECIRADKVMHSGSIDVEMWEEILNADLVIADVSTSNWNAAYELGVRHALRPGRTIVVAENQFEFAFDINHIAITTYTHGGPELGRHEANRFRTTLTELITATMADADGRPDSPVFLSLPGLEPPLRGKRPAAAEPVAAGEAAGTPDQGAAEEAPPAAADPAAAAWGTLRDQAMAAKSEGDWEKVKTLLSAAHAIVPREDYITQQLALATYKSETPSPAAALAEAREILEGLNPVTSHDPETLGLWAAVHKNKWYLSEDPADLDEAIKGNEKGFYLKGDYYNGINLAFLLNVRAALPGAEPAEAITDYVTARRVRRKVAAIVDRALAEQREPGADDTEVDLRKRREERYWLLATRREAAVGLADGDAAEQFRQEALATDPETWMVESTDSQIAVLEGLLASSPLDLIGAAPGSEKAGKKAKPPEAAGEKPKKKHKKDKKGKKKK